MDPDGLKTPHSVAAITLAGALAGGAVNGYTAYLQDKPFLDIAKSTLGGCAAAGTAGFFAAMGNMQASSKAWNTMGITFDLTMNAATGWNAAITSP